MGVRLGYEREPLHLTARLRRRVAGQHPAQQHEAFAAAAGVEPVVHARPRILERDDQRAVAVRVGDGRAVRGYDALDRITSTELANGMRSEAGFVAAGRLNALTSKRSGAVEETLTQSFAAGRPTSSVDSAFTGSETYAYDSVGRVSTITYPGGERRELAYDLRSRTSSERFVDPGGATLIELLYSYDLANRIISIRRNPGNLPLLAYTYTGGFVTRTDYGSGLHRTATLPIEAIAPVAS